MFFDFETLYICLDANRNLELKQIPCDFYMSEPLHYYYFSNRYGQKIVAYQRPETPEDYMEFGKYQDYHFKCLPEKYVVWLSGLLNMQDDWVNDPSDASPSWKHVFSQYKRKVFLARRRVMDEEMCVGESCPNGNFLTEEEKKWKGKRLCVDCWKSIMQEDRCERWRDFSS